MPRRPLAAAIVLVGLLSACSSGGDSLSFVRLSGPLPSFSGATLGGGSFGPTDYAGRVLVVNFWNYDCPPCRQEQPVLQAAWTALRGKGVSFVGVMFVGGVPAWPDDRIAARAYLQTYGVTHSLYITDPDGNEIELYIDVQPELWREDPQAIVAPVKALRL